MAGETILKQAANILEDLEMVNALAIMVLVGVHEAHGRDILLIQIKELIEDLGIDMEVDEIIKFVDKILALKED